MVASNSFADFLREQLAPLGHVAMRRMFGKTGVFCDGLMFAMVTDDTLCFRVDDHNREALKEADSFSAGPSRVDKFRAVTETPAVRSG